LFPKEPGHAVRKNILNTKLHIPKIILLSTLLAVCVNFSMAQRLQRKQLFNRVSIDRNSSLDRNSDRPSRITSQPVLTTTSTQSINFGAYCVTGNGGGTVTVGWDGTRSSTGNIVLLNIEPTAQPAIFELKLCRGNRVSFTFNATSILTGSNGGSMTFDIGPTEKGPNGSGFTLNSDCNFTTPLSVGGTLHVPASVIPGTYSGNFDITFIPE